MPKNVVLNGCLDEIELDFVEREATLPLFMKTSIQFYFAELSISNIVLILELFGVERVQDYLEQFDATRSPDAVIDRLQDALTRLHTGTVPVEHLVERNRVSKPLERYTQNTQNVAALKRARDQDLAIHPGQDIEYVVVDDEKKSRERVALAHEEIEAYDASHYETQLVRAVESILSPLGWDRTEIRRELAETREAKVTAFSNSGD